MSEGIDKLSSWLFSERTGVSTSLPCWRLEVLPHLLVLEDERMLLSCFWNSNRSFLYARTQTWSRTKGGRDIGNFLGFT